MPESGDLGETARRLGLAYERLVANRFKDLGYRVVVTPKTGDGGADLLAFDGLDRCSYAVQCKAWATAPKVDAVYEIFSALALLQKRGITPAAGLLICSTPPTAEAQSRASALGIGIYIIDVDGTGELGVPPATGAPTSSPSTAALGGANLAAAEVAASAEPDPVSRPRDVASMRMSDDVESEPANHRRESRSHTGLWTVLGLAAASAVAFAIFHPNVSASRQPTSAAASGGGSGFSLTSPVVTVPSPPTGLRQQGLGSSKATLTWNASTGAAEYVVYVNGSRVGQTSGTQFTVQSLPSDFTGTVAVSAENSAGTSDQVNLTVRTDMSWQDVEARYAPSIVRITTYHGILGTSVSGGTGWFAHTSSGCVIVTDDHVVAGAMYYIDVSPGASPHVTSVVHAHVVRAYTQPDIALLAEDSGACGPPLPLAAATTTAAYSVISVGEPVAVLGLPGLEQVTLTTGTVTAVHQTYNISGIARQADVFAFTAGSVPGNSGSPIFDHFGHVVGVAECGQETNGNAGCAISLSRLLQVLGSR